MSLAALVRGLAGALTAQEQGFGVFDVVTHPFSPAAWATLGAACLSVVCGALLTRRLLARRDGRVWAGACAAVSAFLLFWGPDQVRFWLLPVVLFGLGVLWATRPPRSIQLCVLALSTMLAASNAARYIVPTTAREDPRVAQARLLGSAIDQVDFLLFADGLRPHVDYYGGLRTDSLRETLGRRPKDATCREQLAREREAARERGGRLLVVPPTSWNAWGESAGCEPGFAPELLSAPGQIGTDTVFTVL